jgi:hypothetical protein
MRTIHRAVAVPCSLFVFLLFAFPNYCDRCSYRDVARLLASLEDAAVPPCCAGKAPAKGPPGDSGGHDGDSDVSHTRVPYCIGSTLSSVADHRDILEEIRRVVTPSLFRDSTRAFLRVSVVLDHKESRAPPA